MQFEIKEKEILDILAAANSVTSVKDIAEKLFVSEPTARRRLAALAEKNLIIRTHGGAMINYAVAQDKNVPLYLRIENVVEGKNVMALKARELIKDGDVIFLDASSSAFHLVPYIKSFNNVTVCTNSLKTAITLAEMGVKSVCFGGEVCSSNLACNDYETAEVLKNFNADVFFFSCDAMTEDGILTDNNKDASYIRLQMMKRSELNVLLIDDTKLGKKCWHTLCSVKDVDYCICNAPLPEKIKSLLKNKCE